MCRQLVPHGAHLADGDNPAIPDEVIDRVLASGDGNRHAFAIEDNRTKQARPDEAGLNGAAAR
jgi:hypothetical protein